MGHTGSSLSRATRAAQLQRRQHLLAALRAEPSALDAHDTVVLVDLDAVEARTQELWRCFPYSTLHALRRGACPVPGLLSALEAGRFGQRVDDPAELAAALAQLPPDRIVGAGAGRAEPQLRALVEAGAHINVDSLQELRWLEALQPAPGPLHCLTLHFGWDQRPALQPPLLEGVDASADLAAILSAFKKRGPLRGLALAVHPAWGVEALCAAVSGMVSLALQIEASGGRVQVLDLGDLLPVALAEPEPAPVQALIDRLAVGCPELMLGVLKGRWTLRTGVGAGVFARATAVITRVGSTRRVGARSRAWCGAALPEDAVEVHVHTPDGLLKRGAHAHWDLIGAAGPGAPLAEGRYLPPMAPGDLLWLQGLAVPCAQGRGPVFGVRSADEGLALVPLRPAP